MTVTCTWSGAVKVEWLDNGRDMRLLESLTYTDQNGQQWKALEGDIIDGASIPRFFWRLIGSPFVGRYRRASVIHDVYCKTQIHESPAIHALFHEMMLVDGVSQWVAFWMWLAVRMFGPRFEGVL
ncbi:MAG: DUF1353 domain-containing protein [Candidatus Nanopelagicales bacterium]